MIRRALEEHFHQVVEYELFVLDDGWKVIYAALKKQVPGLLAPMVGKLIRGKFKKHLFERGIARHTAQDVEAMGRADLDAFAALLADREWLVTDHPTKTDASAFGLLGAAVHSLLETPACRYARTLPPVVAFVDRARARFFPELTAARGAGVAAAG